MEATAAGRGPRGGPATWWARRPVVAASSVLVLLALLITTPMPAPAMVAWAASTPDTSTAPDAAGPEFDAVFADDANARTPLPAELVVVLRRASDDEALCVLGRASDDDGAAAWSARPVGEGEGCSVVGDEAEGVEAVAVLGSSLEVSGEGPVDEAAVVDGAFAEAIPQRGTVVVEEDRISAVFRAPVPWGVLIGRLAVADGDGAEQLQGPVEVSFPPDCGDGVVEDDLLLLVVDAASCGDAGELTLRFDDGHERSLARPNASVEERGGIELAELDPALGRGGSVTIRGSEEAEGVLAMSGLRVAFQADGDECGRSDVNENGAYAVSLTAPCARNETAQAVLLGSVLATAVELGVENRADVSFVPPAGSTVLMLRATDVETQAPIGEDQVITLETREERPTTCATTAVQRDGAVLVVLTDPCAADGTPLRAALGDGRTAELSVPRSSGVATIDNLSFQAVPDDPVSDPPTQREEQVLSGWMIFALLATLLVLVALSILLFWRAHPGEAYARLVRELAKHPERLDADVLERLSQVAPETQTNTFKPAFLLALLVAVTVALVALTLGGTVTEQGALTILGAIVGYAAGRGAGGDG